MDYPADLRYTAQHEWVRRNDDGTVLIGITAYAQDALGDVVYVSLPQPGDPVQAGAAIGEVESTKSVSELYAPLSGTVSRVNEVLANTPELVNADPYGDGWMIEVRLADGLDGPAGSEGPGFDDLLTADDYRSTVDNG